MYLFRKNKYAYLKMFIWGWVLFIITSRLERIVTDYIHVFFSKEQKRIFEIFYIWGWVLFNITSRIERIVTEYIHVSFSKEQTRIFENVCMGMGFVHYHIPYRAYSDGLYTCIFFERTKTHI